MKNCQRHKIKCKNTKMNGKYMRSRCMSWCRVSRTTASLMSSMETSLSATCLKVSSWTTVILNWAEWLCNKFWCKTTSSSPFLSQMPVEINSSNSSKITITICRTMPPTITCMPQIISRTPVTTVRDLTLLRLVVRDTKEAARTTGITTSTSASP